MSYLVADPESLTSAATDLSNIGSTLNAAHAAAAPTTNKSMAIARGFAATVIFAGLAVGTASAAWADTTMNGHYIETEMMGGQQTTNDWYVTPCGDGCASIKDPGGMGLARLVNGKWTMDGPGDLICPDNSRHGNATSDRWTWDPNTLAGTVAITYNVPACGMPAGFQDGANFQLRLAP